MLSRLALTTGRSLRAPAVSHVRRMSLAPTRQATAVAAQQVEREVSSFQHQDGRTSLLKHITGGGALAEDSDMKRGVLTSVRQKELWPLLISIGLACVICAYKVGRMSFVNPETFWNKDQRMSTIQDKDRLTKEGKAFAAHKAAHEVVDKHDMGNITLLGLQPKMKGRDKRHE